MPSPTPDLPPAVPGQRREIDKRSGLLSFYVDGEGAPALLLHSINAAASAYEVRPIYERLRERRRVYAPDLPGFGFSERSRRDYNVALYVDTVLDMLEVIAEDNGEVPVDALALSLSAEFLARAAAQHPARFRSLMLITPTGFTAVSDRLREEEGATREMAWLSSILEVRLWRQRLYKLLVSPRSIRYFLRRTFGSNEIDEDLAAYCDITTHQPGAEHAPYAFLSGRLFSKDIRDVYERLQMPVWLAHGTRGDFQDFSGAGWTALRDNWKKQTFDTGALPHFEQPERFQSLLDEFLTDIDQR